MTLASGTRLGPYEITESIGSGGMGAVYRARDTNLKRDVAIKVLPESFSADPDRLARFQREAEVLASLNHYNIAQVYGVERTGGANAIVMELVDGPTLADRLAHGAIPVPEAVDVAVQITAALEAAHASGVIHRDLKPANIKLRPDGTVKVLDFGLAKIAEIPGTAGGPNAPALTTPALTEIGMILGTAAYMSPEQARGRALDKRADIWAFGAVLYEMLTGQAAFPGEDVTDTVAAVLRSEPDWSALPPLPPLIETFLRQCLQKEPKNRVHDIADVRLALSGAYRLPEPLPSRSGEEAPRPSALWRLGLPAVIAGALLGAAAFGFWSGAADVAVSPVSLRQLTFRQGSIGTARFAPDGQVVVYGAAWDDEPFRLYTTRLDAFQSRPLDLPAQTDLMAVSNDGTLALAMGRRTVDGWQPRGLMGQVDLAGGAPRILDDGVVSADWGVDGALTAIVRRVDGQSQLEFPVGTVVHRANVIGPVRVSPDGNEACFSAMFGELLSAARGGTATVLAEPVPRINSCAWSADGEEIWFTYTPTGSTHTNLEAVARDGGSRRVLHAFTSNVLLHDVSPAGTALIASGALRYSAHGAPSSRERERDLSVFDASRVHYLSADGTQVLISDSSTGSQGGGGGRLFLRPMDGSAPTQLELSAALGLTPDGNWIAMLGDGEPSDTFGSDRITLVPTGAGSPRTISLPVSAAYSIGNGLGTNSWDTHYPEFSQDGNRLLLPAARDADGIARAYVHDLAEGWTRPVTPEGITGPVVLSPDGRHVASNERDGLFVYAVDTGERRAAAGGPDPGVLKRWSLEEDVVFLVEPDGAGAKLVRRNVVTGERELVREVRVPDAAGVTRFDLHVARDGEAYAYTLDRSSSNLFVIENLPEQ